MASGDSFPNKGSSSIGIRYGRRFGDRSGLCGDDGGGRRTVGIEKKRFSDIVSIQEESAYDSVCHTRRELF